MQPFDTPTSSALTRSIAKMLLVACSAAYLVGCTDSDSGSANTDTSGTGASTIPNNNPSNTGSDASEDANANASFSTSIDVTLSGTQVVPVVATRAQGSGTLTLNRVTRELNGTITHSVSNATSASVVLGAAGQSGDAAIVNLVQESNSTYSIAANTILSEAQAASFAGGELFISISSMTHPNGEIRAQVTDAVVTQPLQATLDDIQAKVFTPTCSGCHTGDGITLPGVMNLTTADASYNSLVNAASLTNPDIQRVMVNVSEESLLIMKLIGAPNVGNRMPFRGIPLDTADIDAIRAWINAGAQR